MPCNMCVAPLQVDVGGVCIEFNVSPVLATLLMAFDTTSHFSAQQLSDTTGLPVALVRRKLLFWIEQGVIQEEVIVVHSASESAEEQRNSGAATSTTTTTSAAAGTMDLVYARVSTLDASRHNTYVSDADMSDEPLLGAGNLSGATKSLLEEMSVFEPYIMGVLMNTGGLALDRLHAMLKRFVVSPKFDRTVEQLAAFMTYMVQHGGKVELQGGVYKKRTARVTSEN